LPLPLILTKLIGSMGWPLIGCNLSTYCKEIKVSVSHK
jgi:hypothetical protein